MKLRLAAAASLFLAAVPAFAVGLGPLRKEGVTDNERKAFYLTLINPYATAERFRAYPVGIADEVPAPRVSIFPAEALVGGGQQRRLLIVVRDLQPAESLGFRVCAERQEPNGIMIHARVCSKLVARRLPAGR